MHEELVEELNSYYRSYAACGDKKAKIANLLKSSADAIAELNEIVAHQAEILKQYGGETGILQSEEFAAKYWEMLAQSRERWIGVEEKLPKDDTDVLVTDGEECAVGYWRPEANAWDSCSFGWIENRQGDGVPPGIGKVTFWMPLPGIPGGNTNV